MKRLSPPLFAGICCALPLIVLGILALSKRAAPGESGANAGVQTIATASLPSPSPSPSPAPAFRLTNIGGTAFTNEDLRGKPAILWFTTTYCVPCQLGAEEVKKLDDDLGGSAFNVVMVFIDPRETDKDLLFWKESFANPDWYMAHGNDQLIQDYKIRSLDTQVLVDKEGLVREVNYGLVGYDDYKNKFTPLL